MQRDYCWARTMDNQRDNSLVTNYIRDLQRLSIEKKESRMGLIYAYEMPPSHIQLCDGQQRVTTLFLLIGVIVKRISNQSGHEELLKEANDVLISELERHDDHEPRLQYAIRESTLSYLRDLVLNYFLGNSRSSKDSEWYFRSYDEDPTIQNMVEAINQIDNCLSTDNEENAQLLHYVMHRISFLYIDMETRRYGEEQFVVINTTGKPLTISEHLKPLLLGKIKDDIDQTDNSVLRKYSDMWESWEQLFWKHRPKDENNFVVDDYVHEMLRWVYICEKVDKEPLSSDPDKYSNAQRVLQGGAFDIRKILPSSIPGLFDIVDFYKESIEYLIDNNISIDSSLKKDNCIERYSLLDIMYSDRGIHEHAYYRLSTRHCALLLPALKYIKQRIRTPELININTIKRILHFCWIIMQYRNDQANYYTGLLLSLTSNLTGDLFETVLEKKWDSLTTTGIKRIIQLLKGLGINAESAISDEEKSLFDIEHLNCVRGRIDFVLDTIDNDICITNVSKMNKILAQTFEAPDTLFRRALLSYTDYSTPSGGSWKGWRYGFAVGSNYFYEMIQKTGCWYHSIEKNEERHRALLLFLKDAFNSDSTQDFLRSRLDCSPVVFDEDSDQWKAMIGRLYSHEHWFDDSLGYFLWNWDEKAGYMLRSYKATDQYGSYSRIIPESQFIKLHELRQLLGNWNLREGYSLENTLIQGKLMILAEYKSIDESLGTLHSYVWADNETWGIYKESLLKEFSNNIWVDSKEDCTFIHLPLCTKDDCSYIVDILKSAEYKLKTIIQ